MGLRLLQLLARLGHSANFSLIVVLFCSMALISCDQTSSNMQVKEDQAVELNRPAAQPEIPELQLLARDREPVSVITNSKSHCWETGLTQNDERTVFSVDFIEPMVGWMVASDKVRSKEALRDLYKTNDGGTNWQKVTPEFLGTHRLSLVRFLSERVGWIAVQEKPDSSNVETILHIYRTFDGGKTWSTAPPIEALRAVKIDFNEKGEGWLLGHRKISVESTLNIGAIFHSNDFGVTWNEVSPATTVSGTQTKEMAGTFDVEGAWIDFFSPAPSVVVLLSATGQVVQTRDGGSTWLLVNDLLAVEKDKIAGGGEYHLIAMAPDSRIFVVGGRNSQEGVLTDVVIIENNKVLKKYRASKVYVEDVLFSKDKGLLLGGTLIRVNRTNNSIERVPVVMTTDDMSNWYVVFEGIDDCATCSFFRLSARLKSIVAASRSGTFARLSPITINGIECREHKKTEIEDSRIR